MSRLTAIVLAILGVAGLSGCDLVDPARPTPQPDTETFGALLEVESVPDKDGVWIAAIRIRVPRALGAGEAAQPTPEVAGGMLAVVTVTTETIVLLDDRPAAVTDIGPGTEVVAIPAPGTTTAHGEGEVRLAAAQLMDFATYARWKMPKLALPSLAEDGIDDPAAINSRGVEASPVPVGDGRVLYFTARLRPPTTSDETWIGAQRNGLDQPVDGGRSADRVYRTELGPDGWSAPELVVFPGIGPDQHAKVTWVSGDERRCLLTISSSDGSAPWVGVSQRATTSDPWGEVILVEGTEGGDAFDATRTAGDPAGVVFASTRSGGGDLYLVDPSSGQTGPLQPEINSGRLEWGARVGPEGELYFVRGDRQMRFRGGRVDEVRLPVPHRAVIIEATPTGDGRWLFFAMPKLRPIEFDFDIYVAPLAEDGSVGTAVAVDEWRPFEGR